MSNWLRTMKILLISSGVVSLAMAVKLVLPLMYELPTVYSMFFSLFKPPYLYVIINGIIITIVASTRFSHGDSQPTDEQSQPLISAKTTPPVEFTDALSGAAPVIVEELLPAYEDKVTEVNEHVMVNDTEVMDDDHGERVVEKGEDLVVSRSTYTPLQTITAQETEVETVTEKLTVTVPERPTALSRFAHRKPLKSSPEGSRALKVARPRRQETLESTWRMITEGRHVPLTRHMRKSETFDNNGRNVEVTAEDDNSSATQVRKSETSKDRKNLVSLGKIHKEPSLSQDELNRRVEAFIRKINMEMRLQREESLKQYMEMINRGV